MGQTGNNWLMGTSFLLEWSKCLGTRYRWWFCKHYQCIKWYWIFYLKMVNFMLCDSHLNLKINNEAAILLVTRPHVPLTAYIEHIRGHHFYSILPSNAYPQSDHRKTQTSPNWGISYNITDQYSSQVSRTWKTRVKNYYTSWED